jgi:hypothetical protein
MPEALPTKGEYELTEYLNDEFKEQLKKDLGQRLSPGDI